MAFDGISKNFNAFFHVYKFILPSGGFIHPKSYWFYPGSFGYRVQLVFYSPLLFVFQFQFVQLLIVGFLMLVQELE